MSGLKETSPVRKLQGRAVSRQSAPSSLLSDVRSGRPRLSPGGRARGRTADRVRIARGSGCSYVRAYETRRAGLALQDGLGGTENHAGYCSGPSLLTVALARASVKARQRTQFLPSRARPALQIPRAHEACSRGVSSSGRLEGLQWMTCFIRSQNSWDLISLSKSVLIFWPQINLLGSQFPAVTGLGSALVLPPAGESRN